MASCEASFMLMCCTAASAPPNARPERTRISPMWLTSKTPTAPRTALCSATRPPLDGYSTGMSQPPKLTIFAPSRRCTALSDVFRSSLTVGVLTDSIPQAQGEIDINTRSNTRQRRAPRRILGRARTFGVGAVLEAERNFLPVNASNCVPKRLRKIFSAPPRICVLPLQPSVRYSFQGGSHARSYCLLDVRQDGR